MATPLWTGLDFVQAMGGSVSGGVLPDITGISIDSRTVGRGEAFFAILGDRFDGHDFVEAAFDGGAACAVVAREQVHRYAASARLVVVEDVLAGLRDLGRAARARTSARVIAVTGSVGKTGTKEALRHTLGTSGVVHASVASFNNHWGVPLTLARMPADVDFGVFEIGMNHADEITPLVQMVKPHVAMVTTVEAVHLEFFESVAGIAEAKAEIFLGLQPGGTALVNRDNPYCDLLMDRARMAGATRIVTFGGAAKADIRLIETMARDGGSDVIADVMGTRVSYRIGAPGAHFVQNSLCVLGALEAVDLDLGKASAGFAEMRAPKGRGETHSLPLGGGSVTLIDDSYNANPASMRAALAVLGTHRPRDAGRRIAVLGDMLELGEGGDQLHAELAGPVADAGVSVVFASGPLMSNLVDALPDTVHTDYTEAPESLSPLILGHLRPGDVVMVKGSLGSRMGPIVDALKTQLGGGA
ncbi:MAG: UDP-N-acetylmuramoylalanyl-D-glutamyl-2,6-diaminopimelate--D-alanyl-D-alanine ligase [Pseudomonadota bacterium]